MLIYLLHKIMMGCTVTPTMDNTTLLHNSYHLLYTALSEGGAPADYSVITEARDTSDGGMVYSTVGT